MKCPQTRSVRNLKVSADYISVRRTRSVRKFAVFAAHEVSANSKRSPNMKCSPNTKYSQTPPDVRRTRSVRTLVASAEYEVFANSQCPPSAKCRRTPLGVRRIRSIRKLHPPPPLNRSAATSQYLRTLNHQNDRSRRLTGWSSTVWCRQLSKGRTSAANIRIRRRFIARGIWRCGGHSSGRRRALAQQPVRSKIRAARNPWFVSTPPL